MSHIYDLIGGVIGAFMGLWLYGRWIRPALAWMDRRLACLLGLHGPVETAGLHRMHCLSCDKEFSE